MIARAGQITKKRRRQPEQGIQGMLVRSLRMILPRDSLLFAVPNGGKRTKFEGPIFVGQGVVAGITDLILLWSGRAFGMEVKTDKGTLTDKQIAAHEAMARAGVPVAVVRSLQDAIAFLRANNVPLRIAA